VNTRRYIKPPWMQRHVGNRMSVLFRPSLLSKLSVRGRRSGRWHTTPVAVLEHDGERYLVSYRGASDWARNLEASHTGRLTQRGRVEEIEVAEVPVVDRAALLDAYRDRYGKMPTVSHPACTPRSRRPSHVPDHLVAACGHARAFRHDPVMT
jgi:deazaflavin-dependent oxidoreductase (nitroreductase family)